MPSSVLPLDLLNANCAPIQDWFLLQGKTSPGVCTFTGAGSPRDWDKQKGYAFSGASLIYTGDNLSDFDCHIDLWEKSGPQWVQWNDFAKVLEKRSTGLGAKFLDISHPLLYRAPLRITQVAIRDVTQWTQSPTGLHTCTIMFTAWKAPTPALGKPDGGIPDAGGGIPDLSKDPAIKALLDKQAALGGAL